MNKTVLRYGTHLLSVMAMALGVRSANANELTLCKQYGFIAFENGQIVRGMSPTSSNLSMDHGWLERALMQFTNEFAMSARAKMVLSIEAQLGFTYPQNLIDRSTYLPRFWLYPARVEGVYSFEAIDKQYLQFGFGYFPYQVNKSVRNLGEFLFRSGTYPPFLVNNFNQPFTRLLGFRLSSQLGESFQQDLLLTSEMPTFPTQDFSLSYVTHYTVAHCLELGAGISFAHLFSVNHQLTSPTIFKDRYDSLAAMYITKNGDTAYYSFAGIKPDILLSFDPKPLLPAALVNMLGKEDGKLYAEACVIGWENHTNYNTDTNYAFPDYHHRWDRSAVMFGINVPAFKLFDVLSAEFEYKPTTYPNSYKNVIDDNLPIPIIATDRTIVPWKWSFYAKKTFLEKFSIIGQVARDHMRPNVPLITQAERDDVLFRPGDWWWVLRLLVKY
jgi:hypothetical protein